MTSEAIKKSTAEIFSSPFHPDAITKSYQLTKSLRRDVYDSVDPKNPKNSAAGKSVLITGGGYGIGKGIALTWARADASAIIISGRKKEKLEETAEEIRKEAPSSKVLVLQFDLMDEQSIVDMFARVKQEIGQLDVLICNAFGNKWPVSQQKIGEHESTEDYWGEIEINARGTYYTIHHYIRTFGTTGTIISLTSLAAVVLPPDQTAYALSKRLLISLVECLHEDYPSLRVFSLNPGLVPTQSMPEAYKPWAHDTPELVGGVALYMACGRMEYARGRFVSVNWDVDEMEEHKEELVEKELLKFGFSAAKWQNGGHPFET